MKPTRDFAKEVDLRFEKKFFISNKTAGEIEAYVKCNSAIFSEIYQQRRVNNIYFDSVSKNSFWQNIDGDPEKKKQRIRWYGCSEKKIDNPVLEYKIKKGMIGKKYSIAIDPFNLSKDNWQESLSNSIFNSKLSNALIKDFDKLEPALLNYYDRKYFLSKDKRFRLTLDTNMTYLMPSRSGQKFLWKRADMQNMVLELKYSVEDDIDARAIYQQFPYRISKHSKYVVGVSLISSIRNLIFNEFRI